MLYVNQIIICDTLLLGISSVCVCVIVGACDRQGKVLAKYLEYNHKSVKLAGKRVLELGSGA